MATYKKSREEGCCSISFLKYVLFIFNFVFLLSGLAVLGVGIWTVVWKHEFVSLLSTSTYVSIAYLLIVSGVIVLAMSIVGFVGVWREDRCALLLYTFMLLLIFLMEAVAGVIAYVYEDQIQTELQAYLNSTFLQNYKYNPYVTKDIDRIQSEFKCCGGLSYSDWKYSRWLKGNPHVKNLVPDSCCKTESPDCGIRDHPSNIYYDGCINRLKNLIQEHLEILGAVGLGLCIVPVFGMVLSCCLYVKLRDYDDRY